MEPARLLCPWDCPGKNTGVDCGFLLQGIFLTQELNPGLLHCRRILYWLSWGKPPSRSAWQKERKKDEKTVGVSNTEEKRTPSNCWQKCKLMKQFGGSFKKLKLELLCVLSHFSHVRLCKLAGHSPTASSVHGILQARKLEWVAMPSSRGSSRPRDQTQVSYSFCTGRRVLYHQRHLGSPLWSSTSTSVYLSGGNNNTHSKRYLHSHIRCIWRSIHLCCIKVAGILSCHLHLHHWTTIGTAHMCSMGRMEWLVLCRQLMLCLSNKYVRPFPGEKMGRTSLAVQWLRVHLPVQGTQVRYLLQEDSICCGAANPVHC